MRCSIRGRGHGRVCRARPLTGGGARAPPARDRQRDGRARTGPRLRLGERPVGTLLADGRFAARMLRKSPVFTVVVVFVISLGSGAVTTIFSGMNALVLRPLPGCRTSGRLVSLRPARRDGTVAEQGSHDVLPLPARSRAHDGGTRRVGPRLAHHRRRRPGHGGLRQHGQRQLLRRARRPAGARAVLRRGRGSYPWRTSGHRRLSRVLDIAAGGDQLRRSAASSS